jgi:FMN phosphatase YigB (HAD superfamily)
LSDVRIKNIVFDLGNTLVFFDYEYFFDGVYKLERKLKPATLKKYFRDNRLDIHIGTGRTNIRDSFRKLKKKHDLSIGFDDFHTLYCDIFWENTKMKHFLEDKLLDSGLKLFMLSNVDSSHINFINNNFPYVRHIKRRVLSYKVNAVKPEKKIYRHLIDTMNLNPAESLFIDDLKPNIIAAVSLGFNTIHYSSHNKFLKEFRDITGLG